MRQFWKVGQNLGRMLPYRVLVAATFAAIMGVDRFEDLIAWQLADQLKTEIFAFTSLPPASRDFKYCDQIRDSIRSVTRNTAEGFGRQGASGDLTLRVAEEVQQWLHDTFLDPTWPACPEHRRHPLWLSDEVSVAMKKSSLVAG